MKKIKRAVWGLLVVLAMTVHGTPLVSAATLDSPESIVMGFQNNLIEVMKVAETLSVSQRFDHLSLAVDRAFHLPLMVQIAVGSHWKTTDQGARSKVLKAFRRMSISTLATLFDGYGGETFEHQKNKSGPSNTILVMTDLVKSDNSRIQIAYVTRQFKSGWRIIDVVLDGGISELKVRRSEYRQVLNNTGISGLVDLLNDKADELMSPQTANK